MNATDLKTQFEIPQEAGANVTLRRMQNFRLKPGETFHWTFDTTKGEGQADAFEVALFCPFSSWKGGEGGRQAG